MKKALSAQRPTHQPAPEPRVCLTCATPRIYSANNLLKACQRCVITNRYARACDHEHVVKESHALLLKTCKRLAIDSLIDLKEFKDVPALSKRRLDIHKSSESFKADILKLAEFSPYKIQPLAVINIAISSANGSQKIELEYLDKFTCRNNTPVTVNGEDVTVFINNGTLDPDKQTHKPRGRASHATKVHIFLNDAHIIGYGDIQSAIYNSGLSMYTLRKYGKMSEDGRLLVNASKALADLPQPKTVILNKLIDRIKGQGLESEIFTMLDVEKGKRPYIDVNMSKVQTRHNVKSPIATALAGGIGAHNFSLRATS